MKYVVAQPDQSPEIKEVEKISLKDLQAGVGGLITGAYAPELAEQGIDIYANDEGLLIGLRPNVGWLIGREPMILVGGLVFTSSDEEGETIGLTDEQIETVKAWLVKRRATLAGVMLLLALGR